jgi:hypothetical protein
MERRVRRCQDGLHFGHCVTGSSRSSPVTCDRSRSRESHKLFLGTAACDCTCECWGNAGIPQDMREAPNRLIFPGLSHRINLLTRILSPCVAWRCLRVERAMGHTSRPQPLVIARFFACLAPTMYLNMYSFGRHDNLVFPGWSIDGPVSCNPPRAGAGLGASFATS